MHSLVLSHTSFGAQLLQVRLSGNEILYNSPLSKIESGQSFRGGIPILFPQFGNLGPLQKHGFARDVYWQLVKEDIHLDYTEIEYEYIIEKNHYYNWGNNAILNLKVNSSQNIIRILLQIKNTGISSFYFTGGLHPYFKIKSRSVIKITGMEETCFEDAFPVKNFNLNDDSMIERLYLNNNEITFYNGYSHLLIKSSGFNNWMFWNPGSECAKNILDLPNEDWDKFFCIEPVLNNKAQILKSNDIFKGELIIELLD